MYWKLSQFYFFYFASIGALVPFWTVYLKDLNFSALEIGQLMATLAVSKVLAPYIWGWIADYTGFHVRIVQITSLISLFCFLPLLWLDSYWMVLWTMLAFSFFWNASLPQFEVVTLGHLGDDKFKYSSIRLWGSLGFIFTVVTLGALFEWVSIDILPVIILGTFVFIWFSSLPVKEFEQPQVDSGSILQILKKPQVIALLLSCFFIQASHGPYYTFYSIYMESLEYTRFSIGLLWSLGVLSEVVLFVYIYRLFKIKSVSFWLSMALLLTAVRWLIQALYSEFIVLVVIAQCLHAASFGLYHASAIHLIDDYFPCHRGRGQAIYASVSFGAGGVVGSLLAGSLWDQVSPTATFLMASLLAFVGLMISLAVKPDMDEKPMNDLSRELKS